MKQTLIMATAILLISSISAVAQPPAARSEGKSPAARIPAGCAELPAERIVFLSLFELTGFVTGPPFIYFPALGGADKTKFVNDDLINRDELMHLAAFLEFQVNGPDKYLSGALTGLHRQMLSAAQYLLGNFDGLATHRDAQGNSAIGPEAIRRMFSCLPARSVATGWTRENSAGSDRLRRRNNEINRNQ